MPGSTNGERVRGVRKTGARAGRSMDLAQSTPAVTKKGDNFMMIVKEIHHFTNKQRKDKSLQHFVQIQIAAAAAADTDNNHRN